MTTRGQDLLVEVAALRQELPFSPEVLRDLFSLTGEDSTAPMQRIVEAVSKDQGLAARVLAMANSAFYGLQAKVTTVSRAVFLLGLKELRTLVLVLSAQTLTKKHPPPPEFDLKESWRHQLHVGVCARMMASQVRGLDGDALFTAGLLHDIGKLLTALVSPADWAAVAAKARNEGVSFAAAEEALLGLDHGVLGAMALNAWNLPPSLTEPINWHHAPQHAPVYGREALAICAADTLVHSLESSEAPAPAVLRIMEAAGADLPVFVSELKTALQDERLNQFLSHVG